MNRHQPVSTQNARRVVCNGVLLAMLAAFPARADSPTTMTHCEPLDGRLKYACSVMLQYQGAPLRGAQIVQRADMPSMPLAHNLPPSKPSENPDQPGRYDFEIELEMHGRWMFTYDVRAPVRDRIQEKVTFVPGDAASSMPSKHTHQTQSGAN